MATVIDQKIVQLKFDNSNFEQNTRQSMSTLDKLKEKLHFKGASEGLESIEKAARKVNMDSLANGVEQVKVKFSALEVMGVTALANITNSAVNMGKALLSSITIDPLKSGWNKMSELMASVQTLKNSTGLATDEIQKYLDTLMWYSDETSYSFTDMTSSLATMTSAGGDIKKLIPMITGIANATAFAGKGANEFAITIRNLTQAYSKGHLELTDWKSLQLANTNSKQLKQSFIDVGVALGKIKKGQVNISNFERMFGDKRSGYWLDNKVMEKTFNTWSQLTMAVNEASEQGWYYLNELDENGEQAKKDYKTAAEAIEDFANGAAVSLDKVGQSFADIAIKGFRAAQEAKTFKEAILATADGVSSAWMSIYETIFGNFDDQKRIWTNLSNYLYEIFVTPLYNFQEKLEEVFTFDDKVGSLFDKIQNGLQAINDKINNNPLAKGLDKITEKTQQATKSLDYYQKIVWNVWEGNYKNAPKRYALLKKAGYDYRVVQELVNIGARNGQKQKYKITLEDVIKAEKKYGYTVTETEAAIDEETKALFGQAKALDELTDEQLKKLGLDKDEIDMYNRLKNASKKYGYSLDELMTKLKLVKARDMLFGAPKLVKKQKNGLTFEEYGEDGNEIYSTDENGNEVLKSIQTIGAFTALLRTFRNVLIMVKQAWAEVFSFDSLDIYMAIDRFKNFANAIYNVTRDEDKMKNLKDTFKGIFSVLKLISTVVSIPMKIAWTIFKTVLQTFGVTLLDVTGAIGNVVSRVVDWITNNSLLIDGIKWLTEAISGVIVGIYQWIQKHVQLNKLLENLFGTLGDLKKRITDFFVNFWEGAKEAKKNGKLGEYLVQAFTGALKKLRDKLKEKGGIVIEWISSTFGQLGGKIGEWFKGLDPAKKAGQLGKYIIDGLWIGLKSGGNKLFEGAKWIFDVVFNTIKGLFGIESPSKVMMAIGGFIVSGLLIGIKDNEGNVLSGIESFGGGILDTIKKFANYVLSLFGTTGEKLIEIIKSIDLGSIFVAAISAGGIFAIIKMAKAITILSDGLASINGILAASQKVVEQFSGVLKAFKVKLYTMALKDIAIAVAILVGSIWVITKLDPDKVYNAVLALTTLMIGLCVVLAMAAKASSISETFDMGKLGLTLLALGASMLLIAIAVKKLAGIDAMQWQGILAIVATIGSLLGALAIMGKAKVDLSGMSKTLLAVGVMFYLMGKTLKIVGKLKWQDALQGTLVLTAFTGMIIALMYATKYLGNKTKSIEYMGNTLLKIGAAFYLMAMAVKKLGRMKTGEVIQGTAVIAAFGGMVYLFFEYLGNVSTAKLASIGTIMLGIGGSFIMMAMAVKILGKMSFGDVVQGTAIIGGFFAMVWLFIKGLDGLDTTKVGNAGKILLGIGVAMIGIALALALLSLLDPKKLIAPVLALSVVILALKGLVKEVGNLNESNFKSIVTLTVMIFIIGLALGLLTLTNPYKLLAVATGMASVMGALAVLVTQINKMKDLDKKAILNIIAVIAILGAVSGIVYWLSTMNTDSAVKGAIAVTLLMSACIVMMYAMSKLGNIDIKNVGRGLLGLAGVLGVCHLAILVLEQMNGIQNAKNNALVLSEFMMSMTLILIATALVGTLYKATYGIAATGLAGLLILLGLCKHAMSVLKSVNNVTNAEKNAKLIEKFMKSMTKILVVLAIVGPLALIGVGALTALLTVITGMIPILTVIGGLISYFPSLETFIDKGINLFIKLAEGLGRIIAAFVGGIMGQLISHLPSIGENLSNFMSKLNSENGFIANIKKIDNKVATGCRTLAVAIIELSKASFISGILKFFSLGRDLSNVGDELSDFAKHSSGFFDFIKDINPDAIICAKTMADTIMTLTKTSLLNSVNNLLGSKTNFSEFGDEISELGTGMSGFIKNLGNFGKNELDKTKIVVEAIKALADAGSEMKTTGGLLQLFTGTQEDLATWADNLKGVGTALMGFITELSGGSGKSFKESDLKTAETGAKIISSLAKAAAEIPDTQGFSFKKLFVGSPEELQEFTKNLPIVGRFIRTFIKEINGIMTTNIVDAETGEIIDTLTTIDDTMEITPEILKTVDTVSKMVESLAKFAGTDIDADNLKKLGQTLPVIGRNLRRFIDILINPEYGFGSLKLFSSESVLTKESADTVELSTQVLTDLMDALSKIVNKDNKIPDANDLKKIVDIMPSVGRTIRTFIQTFVEHKDILTGKVIEGLNLDEKTSGSITTAVTAFVDVINALGNIVGKDNKIPDAKKLQEIINIMPSVGRAIRSIIETLTGSMTIIDIASLKLKTIEGPTADNITKASDMITMFTTLLNDIKGINIDTTKTDKVFDNLKVWAGKIKDFIVEISELSSDVLETAQNNISILKLILSTYVDNVIKPTISNLFDKNPTLSTKAADQGIKFIGAFANGITSDDSKKKLKEAVSSMSKEVVPYLYDNDNKKTKIKDDVINAGKHVLEGFENGLSNADLRSKINQVAYNIGHKTVEEIKRGADERSPSKSAMKAGKYVTEGFIIGIQEYSARVYNVSSEVGNKAIQGVNDAISTISSLIDSDMDNQPTIRPVLDLSEISAGVNNMNSMFSDPSIGVLSNIKAISSEMNSRIQNDHNSDMASAINKLGNSLNKNNGNVYNINGVTYDDGTNVSNAVRDLIRAIEVERRV